MTSFQGIACVFLLRNFTTSSAFGGSAVPRAGARVAIRGLRHVADFATRRVRHVAVRTTVDVESNAAPRRAFVVSTPRKAAGLCRATWTTRTLRNHLGLHAPLFKPSFVPRRARAKQARRAMICFSVEKSSPNQGLQCGFSGLRRNVRHIFSNEP